MERRRFFPTQAVQTLPGRSVELEMRLQPLATATSAGPVQAADPGGSDVDGAGWLSQAFNEPALWVWEEQPDGGWRVTSSRVDSLWVGSPPAGAAALGLGPVPSAGFRCIELEVSSLSAARLHVGVVYGASMSDVTWAAAWDAPSGGDASVSVVGSRFDTSGNALVVSQYPTGGSVAATETLTATVFCEGVAVETLVLRCRHEEAAVGGTDLFGVGWFSHVFYEYGEWVWNERPDGRWDVLNGVMSSTWEGEPDPDEVANDWAPTPSTGFRCVELEVRSTSAATLHVGVLQGVSMSDVTWVASWDSPSGGDATVSVVGNRFEASGNTIIVRQLETGGSLWATETLTATAYCDGAAAGTLILHCVHMAY